MARKTMLDNLTELLPNNDYYAFLRERADRCCCRYCGGSLEVRRLSYSNCDLARLELYCPDCNRIEFGIERVLYEKACYFLEETGFDYFPDVSTPEQKRQMNRAKVCEIIGWLLKDMGLLGDDGFSKEMPEIRAICSSSSLYEDDYEL